MPQNDAGDNLRTSLSRLLTSGTDTNPALNALLADYTSYHRVLAIVGGAFLLALTTLSVMLWGRFRRSRTPGRGWSFERRTYFGLGLVAFGAALFLGLVVAANVSTVLDPRHGFGGAMGLLGTPRAGTSAAQLQDAFATWLQSGAPSVPPEVTRAIDERLAWQRPKAIITSTLLLGFVAVSAVTWRSLIRRSHGRTGRRSLRGWGLLGAGVLSVAVGLVLMLMVLGNTQGSLAPLSLTLFFG
ncbi:hypothetical protein [Longivirga aurantiaca]|uniref:Uncharacterized protein n=1 Tax=Longivirga aurantiaca TaxID=1837743 RepID=A0ABW1SVJ6_9ACTN